MEDEIAIARTCSSMTEAEMLKGLLEDAGIDAEVYSDDMGGWLPQMQGIAGVQLVVRRADLERARELLEEAAGEEQA